MHRNVLKKMFLKKSVPSFTNPHTHTVAHNTSTMRSRRSRPDFLARLAAALDSEPTRWHDSGLAFKFPPMSRPADPSDELVAFTETHFARTAAQSLVKDIQLNGFRKLKGDYSGYYAHPHVTRASIGEWRLLKGVPQLRRADWPAALKAHICNYGGRKASNSGDSESSDTAVHEEDIDAISEDETHAQALLGLSKQPQVSEY
jgi:hypothetical protein